MMYTPKAKGPTGAVEPRAENVCVPYTHTLLHADPC